MKKLLALLLSVLLLCSMPLSAFAEGTGDGREDSKAVAFLRSLNEAKAWTLDFRFENVEEPMTFTLYKNGSAFALDLCMMRIPVSRVVKTEEEAWISTPLLPFVCSDVDPETTDLPFFIHWFDGVPDTLASDPDLTYTCEEENGSRKETFADSEKFIIFEFEGDRVSRIEEPGHIVVCFDRFETSVPSAVFRRPALNLMVFADLFVRLFQRFVPLAN